MKIKRSVLQLLEEEENKIKALKKAIKDGVDAGRANNFNPKKHLETLKAKKRKIA